MELQALKRQYITDNNGVKTSVILSMKDFGELIEDIEDLAFIATLKEEKTIPYEEVIEDLKANGLL